MAVADMLDKDTPLTPAVEDDHSGPASSMCQARPDEDGQKEEEMEQGMEQQEQEEEDEERGWHGQPQPTTAATDSGHDANATTNISQQPGDGPRRPFRKMYPSRLIEQIEVGTVAPDPPSAASLPTADYHAEELTLPPAPVTLDFKGPGLFGPDTGLGMPTCLLCVCIGGSVYCDDIGLDQIPLLPKSTTHFYGRFNNIRHVKNTDFNYLNQLQSIDLTGNQISGMDEDVFRSLPQLHQLLLVDNNLQALPELPVTMKHIDLRNNRLISNGVHSEGFKDMSQLEFLYLSDNKLDYIPVPLPLGLRVLHLQNNNIQTLQEDTFCNSHDRNFIRRKLEDIRLDGNPLNIQLFPQAYICLPRLPVGSH